MSEPATSEPQRFRDEVRRAGGGGTAEADAAADRDDGTLGRRCGGRQRT